MKAMLAAVALAGCVEPYPPDGDPHGVFELREVRRWDLARPVVAMDSDGADGAWVIFENSSTLVHLASDASTTSEIPIVDLEVPLADDRPWTSVVGLAHAGDVVWVSHRRDANMLRAYDVQTGELRKSFASETGLSDVDAFGDELRYAVIWDVIVGLDSDRGGERWRQDYDGECCGIARGIASMTDDLVWVSTLEERLFLVDKKLGVIGSGLSGVRDDDFMWTVDSIGHHLGWNGTYVLMSQGNEIHWLEPVF